MHLMLNLDYHLKPQDVPTFLDGHELGRLNADALEQVNGQLDHERQLTVILANLLEGILKEKHVCLHSRVSARLLAIAINLKYEKAMPRTEDGGKSMPGRWWGGLQDQLDNDPERLEMTPNQLLWLIGVWNDEKVQKGWSPSMQRWVNVLDDEIMHLKALSENPRAEIVEPIPPSAPSLEKDIPTPSQIRAKVEDLREDVRESGS